MITFPCAKINLGLNIVSKRKDGYHNLETVFYPIPLTDALEIKLMGDEFPSDVPCDRKITGNAVDCDEQNNLVVKAYNLLAADFRIPRIHAHLVKRIPSQAGLGGGSADAAFMIRLLDERFRLNIGNPEMERYAAKLGADCAYFISADPEDGDTACYAEGIGEELMPDFPVNDEYDRIMREKKEVDTERIFAAVGIDIEDASTHGKLARFINIIGFFEFEIAQSMNHIGLSNLLTYSQFQNPFIQILLSHNEFCQCIGISDYREMSSRREARQHLCT